MNQRRLRLPGELLALLAGIALWVFASGGWKTAGEVLALVGAALALIHLLYLFMVVRVARREQEEFERMATSNPQLLAEDFFKLDMLLKREPEANAKQILDDKARYISKQVVDAGLADRCEADLAYADDRLVLIAVRTFGTERIPVVRIEQLVREWLLGDPRAVHG